jgi:hypothetical protein
VPIERRGFQRPIWTGVVCRGGGDARGQPGSRGGRRIASHPRERGGRSAERHGVLGGVIRRDGVTLAISTSGDAPGLTALLRQALDAVLPEELGDWMNEARRPRGLAADRVPMAERRPLLLAALNSCMRSRH